MTPNSLAPATSVPRADLPTGLPRGLTLADALRVAAALDAAHAESARLVYAHTAALAGVPLIRIAAQTRHKDLNVLVDRYIRPLEALATTSSKDLGL